MAKILQKNKLSDMLDRLNSANIDVFGPQKNDTESFYGRITKSEEFCFDLVLPKRPMKELFFPRTEPLMSYDLQKQEVAVSELSPPEKPRIIFGCRPCDAAALAIDDAIFNWDYRDEYWFRRRNHSTIISIACTAKDDFCMCTSLNLSPESVAGCDVLLHELANGLGWQIREITDKGREFTARIDDLLSDSDADTRPIAVVPEKFNLDRANENLKRSDSFDSDFWSAVSTRCVGCGICTYACPTCHCFDIQDEGDARRGVRRKNWDSCSFAMFTQHTSGHNPRPNQPSRWRQRIMHKFNYYPEKFGYVACTGCGRCSRHCPADMGITETLTKLSEGALR
jgi:ferredoxin